MKIFGVFGIIIGVLDLLGCLLKGSNPTGPTYLLAFGIFLVYRANQKQQDEKDKEKWTNNRK